MPVNKTAGAVPNEEIAKQSFEAAHAESKMLVHADEIAKRLMGEAIAMGPDSQIHAVAVVATAALILARHPDRKRIKNLADVLAGEANGQAGGD